MKPTLHECLTHYVPQQASPGPQANRMFYCPLSPTFDPVRRPQLSPGSHDVRLLYCPLAPLIMVRRPQLSPSLSIILLAGPYLRFRSADHHFLPARRPSRLLLPAGSYLYKGLAFKSLISPQFYRMHVRQGAPRWIFMLSRNRAVCGGTAYHPVPAGAAEIPIRRPQHSRPAGRLSATLLAGRS